MPIECSFELHNAGASGVTISAVQLVLPGDETVRHNMTSFQNGWWKDVDGKPLQIPLRLEAYDTKVAVLDVEQFLQSWPTDGNLVWELRVEWYGRTSLLRLVRLRKKGRWYKPEWQRPNYRRLRSVFVPVDLSEGRVPETKASR